MRYRDLIAFEPVESVKQLRAADSADQALEDVRTYIISEKMRQQLTEVVIPHLRFDNPEFDHKGLLLIATYGTGKTHLMSAIAGSPRTPTSPPSSLTGPLPRRQQTSPATSRWSGSRSAPSRWGCATSSPPSSPRACPRSASITSSRL
jgi:hypothetical protein